MNRGNRENRVHDKTGHHPTHGDRLPADRVRVVIVTGPVGAGKTTTMWALGELLTAADVPHAVLDVDQVRTFHPTPPDDRFGSRLGRRNVAAITANYIGEGARILVLADVIEHHQDIDDYARTIPDAQITVVRLDVPMDAILQRLEGRETATTIGWYRDRAPELQEIMEREAIGDIVIDVGQRTPPDVASEIASRLGLLRPSGTPCP